jgi:16S rRNA (cytosine967-C5)-methyltransferase
LQRKGPRDNSPARHIEPDNDFDGPPPGFVPTPARPLPPTTAWNAAFACNLEHALTFPDLSQRAPDISRLDDRDGALAHALVDAAVRRWNTIGYLCGSALGRPWRRLEPGIQAALVTAAGAMMFLDRIPPWAAVNEAVGWTKKAITPAASGLVNACLRRMAEVVFTQPTEVGGMPGRNTIEAYSFARDEIPLADGRALKLHAPLLPEDDLLRLAIVSSHPSDLLAGWRTAFGLDHTRELALHGIMLPSVTLCTRYASSATPLDTNSLTPHRDPGHHVFIGEPGTLRNVLARPDIWVQDAASTKAIASVAKLSPRVIVDLCAGQGTKTKQLAMQFPSATILATDTDAARLAILRTTHAGNPSVRVIDIESVERESYALGNADLVLLDVPCSNTGVLPRRPEAKYRTTPNAPGSTTNPTTFNTAPNTPTSSPRPSAPLRPSATPSPDQLTRLIAIQREILRRGTRLLNPTGTLLYSTCSLEHAENEHQVAWAADNLNLTLVSDDRTFPTGTPGEGPTRYRDGAYSAVMRKK